MEKIKHSKREILSLHSDALKLIQQYNNSLPFPTLDEEYFAHIAYWEVFQKIKAPSPNNLNYSYELAKKEYDDAKKYNSTR